MDLLLLVEEGKLDWQLVYCEGTETSLIITQVKQGLHDMIQPKKEIVTQKRICT